MSNDDRTILVAGATGRQGNAVARGLLDKGYSVRALTRKPDSPAADDLLRRGAEIVAGDLDDPGSVEIALEGAWGVFAVLTMAEAGVDWEVEKGTQLAELAKKAGVTHYVYSSVASADKQTGIPHFESKARIEQVVRHLGFPSHTILRPVFFMENFLSPQIWSGLGQGKLRLAMRPETRLQMIAVRDIGRFGVLAFERFEAMNRAEIDIAGDEKTMPEAAAILGRAMGRGIEFVPMPLSELRKMSEDMAIMFEWFEHVGYHVDIPGLAGKYGLDSLTLGQWTATAPWPKPARP